MTIIIITTSAIPNASHGNVLVVGDSVVGVPVVVVGTPVVVFVGEVGAFVGARVGKADGDFVGA